MTELVDTYCGVVYPYLVGQLGHDQQPGGHNTAGVRDAKGTQRASLRGMVSGPLRSR
jgi:hypothetical protein